MGLLAKIFGTDTAVKETSKTVNNVFDGIASGIDKAFFTKEEKADYNKSMFDLRLKTLDVIMKGNSAGDSLARRIIAFILIGFYFGGGLISWLLQCFVYTTTKGILLYQLITTEPPGYVSTVLFIYFGYYGVSKGVEKWKG